MKTMQKKPNASRRNPKKPNEICKDFEPLKSLDVNKVKNFDEMARAMSKTSFGGRTLGEAVDVLYEMVTDPDCFVVGTFAGAMTPAKMGLLICEMIDRKMLNAVISTGALITHGLVENVGMTHFKYKSGMNDKELYHLNFDRIYDTLELEKNLDDLEAIVHEVFKKFNEDEIASSRFICEKTGEYLAKNDKGRGILKSAFEKKVPVYIPAFSDSEFGLDFALFNRARAIKGKKPIQFNPFLDLEHYAELILKQKKIGIFTIGGGVPRNWGQQVGPYLDLIRFRLMGEADVRAYMSKEGNPYFKRFQYAVRICPEPVHWGGLSGCTYSEGVSWGKFVPEEDGGRFAEVMSDATIAWPIILKAVIERMEKNKK